jgi:selenoprotein W-related protein
LADELKKTLGVEVELIPGSGGIFDVKADGQMVFSKKVAGRFPEQAEVIDALKG